MAVQLNVNNFKQLMKKGTVNHVIDNVKLIFTSKVATAAMRGTDLISSVMVPNEVLLGLKKNDEIDFCFVNPLSNVLPYMEILQGDVVPVASIEEGYIELKEPPHTVKISLFHPNVVTPFDPARKPEIDFFVNFNIDDRFLNFLEKTKRVCASVGKIYLGVKSGYLYTRAGGAANELTSEIALNLVQSDFKDVELNFNYKSFINLMGLLGDGYRISVAFDEDQELGLIKVDALAASESAAETYYLMSRL